MEFSAVYESQTDPERLFINSIKSEYTKKIYLIHLRKFMEFVHCQTLNDLVTGFKNQNSRDIERRVIDFIIHLKEEGKNFQCINNYLTPIISFYKINDIALNTKKLGKIMPAKTRAKKNRHYEHEEIQKLLDIADERMRVVILLLVSGGMRIGSIPNLHVRDLEKHGDVYKVTIYENQREEYFSFITPEASKAIDDYLSMRKRYGEQITPDSPLIREQFDIRDPFAIASPRTIKVDGLAGKIAQLAERAGIREKTPLKEGEKGSSVRKTIPRAHGFRKSFTTFTLNAKMDIIKRRMLEGHSIGIDEHYARPSESDLLEEYTKAIDALTIDPSQRLQRKVEKLEIEKNQFDQLAAQIKALEQRLPASPSTD